MGFVNELRAKSSAPGFWSDEERGKMGHREFGERVAEKEPDFKKKPAETPPGPGNHHVHLIRTFSLQAKF
ncbi:hypothetical protein TNCV_1514881 [Trichonephila clavipes]|nr:hypothetical protein TNCV_1514881 [Trichonephila clavipes]